MINKRGKTVVVGNDFDCDVAEVTKEISACFCRHFPDLTAYAVCDIPGEDHVFAIDDGGKPMFDLLVSASRKFVFLWYYIHPKKGLGMVEEMKKIVLAKDLDYAVKFPNVPVKKAGWPSIVRWGKKPAGLALEKFVVKAGNPSLDEKTYSEENLNTYRNYDWDKNPDAFSLILSKAKQMVPIRLGKNIDKIENIRGYCLYAGCAYHKLYPKLGFGMRDIDVEVLFSSDWFTNTRCAYTHPCDIKEFGQPEYFAGKTRWLDLMWNSFHKDTDNFHNDVLFYVETMRHRSDRWATISQRPIFDLETEELIYRPRWLACLEREINL